MLATLSEKGRVTIPKRLRERYGMLPGSQVDLSALEDGLRIRAKPSGLGALFGLLHRPGAKTVSLQAMQKAIEVQATRAKTPTNEAPRRTSRRVTNHQGSLHCKT